LAPKRKRTLGEHGNCEIISPTEISRIPYICMTFCKSTLSELDLLLLVEIGVLPPKEFGESWSWEGVGGPTEDTYESVLFAPFFVHVLGLPICSFVHGLLHFYFIDLTHPNPNSFFQIAIFIHLCEAFLGIVPHFGLWKYMYHCKPDLRKGFLEVVGGSSLELYCGLKLVFLGISPRTITGDGILSGLLLEIMKILYQPDYENNLTPSYLVGKRHEPTRDG
jgi:hypothetical protein